MLRFIDSKETWTPNKRVETTLSVIKTEAVSDGEVVLEKPVLEKGEIVFIDVKDAILLPPNAEQVYSDNELAKLGLEKFTPPAPPSPPPPPVLTTDEKVARLAGDYGLTVSELKSALSSAVVVKG